MYKFPDKLKVARITPIFKKGDRTKAKKNYRSVIALPSVINELLSSYLFGNRKEYGTQVTLISFIEKMENFVK